jgi:hypothetical protein
MAHVIKTLQDNLKDDPFYGSYRPRRRCWPR